MRMYVLEALWNGDVNPSERCFSEEGQYAALIRRAAELEDSFQKELSAEGKEAYTAFCENQMKIMGISEQAAYIRGVRFGARFMLDVVGDYHSPLPQVGKEET